MHLLCAEESILRSAQPFNFKKCSKVETANVMKAYGEAEVHLHPLLTFVLGRGEKSG
jgi:hypothetical protein